MLNKETLETIEAIATIMAAMADQESQKKVWKKTAEAANAWRSTLHTKNENRASAELEAFKRTCLAIDAWTSK